MNCFNNPNSNLKEALVFKKPAKQFSLGLFNPVLMYSFCLKVCCAWLMALSLPVVSCLAQGAPAAVVPGDFADPSVIRADGQYYAIATSSEWAPHYPIYRSSNLTDWTPQGYLFDVKPEWTTGSFWAPEYFVHQRTYYVYYTARRKSDNVSCIGVATSPYPDHGFVDRGIVVDFGKEAIDAFIYNDNGQLYITFKAYGLDQRPIELLGSKLSADGLKMEGEVFSLLRDDERIGMEGQSLLKHGDFFYLFYSAGACCGQACSYHVRVARSYSLQGPYEKYDGAPLLADQPDWKCPGHGTFVQADNGSLYYLYHAYNRRSHVFTGREGMLAQLSWNTNGWPALAPVDKHLPLQNIVDDFSGQSVAPRWQYDFRHAKTSITQRKGKLRLTGITTPGNNTGVVATVRPQSGAFELEATVTNQNDALKGLVFYGDAGAAIGIGVRGHAVEFWQVKDNVRTVVDSTTLKATGAKNIRLKYVVLGNGLCQAYYALSGKEWKALAAGVPVPVAFLPQWDRSPRAGLHFQGTVHQWARFDDFVMRHR